MQCSLALVVLSLIILRRKLVIQKYIFQCSKFIDVAVVLFYPSPLDFGLLLNILSSSVAIPFPPSSCDLAYPSAYTVAFHLISNQKIPVFTGMFYLYFNFIIRSVSNGARPEYACM